MIISHKHKFIFIKNRKVGGTSVEAALTKICGEDDILTTDNAEGPAIDLVKGPKNWEGQYIPMTEFMYCRTPIDFMRVLRDVAKRPKWYDHMRATSIKARIGSRVWNSYYKFCFEREPISKVTSYFYFTFKGHPNFNINNYILRKPNKLTNDQWLPSDWVRYAYRDHLIVDDVFDFADLAMGLQTAMERAGVDEEDRARLVLPRLKQGKRSDQPRPAISEEAKTIIARVFSREISHFGNYWYSERGAESI